MTGALIQNLLDFHEKVTIPGLGTFSTIYKPAALQFADRTIVPAEREVSFQLDLECTDGQLEALLQSRFGVEKDEAAAWVAGLGTHARNSILQTGKFTMPGFGSLVKDLAGDVHFKPLAEVRYGADYYGFTALSAPTVEHIVRGEIVRETPIIPLHPFDTEEKPSHQLKEEKRTGLLWAPYAAVFAALVVSASAIMFINGQRNTDFVDNSHLVQEAGIVHVPISNSAEKPASAKLVPQKSKASEPVVVEPAETKPVVPTQVHTFFVVAGSFKEPTRSAMRCKQLLEEGFMAEQLANQETGATRVTIGRFASKEEAVAFMQQSQPGFKENLWVYTR